MVVASFLKISHVLYSNHISSLCKTVYYIYVMIFITSDMMSSVEDTAQRERRVLFDHRPLELPEDDYLRVSRIPQRKVEKIAYISFGSLGSCP